MFISFMNVDPWFFSIVGQKRNLPPAATAFAGSFAVRVAAFALAGDRDTLDNVACKRSNCETACKNNYREELFHNCSVFAAVPACFHQLRTRIPNLTSGAPLSRMVFTFRIRAGQMPNLRARSFLW